MARGDFFASRQFLRAADLANVTLAHQKRAPEYFEVHYLCGDQSGQCHARPLELRAGII
jgi:hypothetical protein